MSEEQGPSKKIKKKPEFPKAVLDWVETGTTTEQLMAVRMTDDGFYALIDECGAMTDEFRLILGMHLILTLEVKHEVFTPHEWNMLRLHLEDLSMKVSVYRTRQQIEKTRGQPSVPRFGS